MEITESVRKVIDDLRDEHVGPFLSIQTASTITGRHSQTVWRDVVEGRLVATRVGGNGPWVIRREDLARYIAGSQQ